MAETAAAPAKPTGLTQEEKNALLVHHMSILRGLGREVAEARAPLKAAQEAFTAAINLAKGDLGKAYTRKRLVGLLDDVSTRLRNLLREEEQRFQDRVALGLPVFGQQLDMFGTDATPDEAKDTIYWEAEGYLLGRRAADPKIEGMPPRFEPDLLRGYHRGQEENGRLMKQAAELKRGEPDPAAATVDLNDEDEKDDSVVDIDEAARKLKRGGFTKRSAPVEEPMPAA